MTKPKRTYSVYNTGPGSLNPIFKDTSLWEALRFIAYVFKNDSTKSLVITKE